MLIHSTGWSSRHELWRLELISHCRREDDVSVVTSVACFVLYLRKARADGAAAEHSDSLVLLSIPMASYSLHAMCQFIVSFG